MTQLGNTITVTINAEASVDLQGYAFGGESYILASKDTRMKISYLYIKYCLKKP